MANILGMLGKAGSYIKKNPQKMHDMGNIAAAFGGGIALGQVPNLAMNISNELQDPRFYSNIKGMLTGKSREERIAAHKDLDSSKFRKLYGDESINAYSEEQAVKVLDAVKKSLKDDKSVPKELFSKMMEIDPSDYAGFFGGEDFAEELNAFQSLISKNYRQREDGRYVFDDNLLLKEGQTPRGWVKDSYGFGTPVQQQEGQELFGIKPEDVVRY